MAEEEKKNLTPFEVSPLKVVHNYLTTELEKVNNPSQIEAGVAGVA